MKKRNILTYSIFMLSFFIVTAEIPAGYYYTVNGKNGEELLDELNKICSNGIFLSYGAGEGYTWGGFYYTDRNQDGTVMDMYSDIVREQTGFNAVSGLHIEHSLPKSWWGGLENYAYRDLHHLFPADETVNITKNNLPLGIVKETTFDNGVSKIGANGHSGAFGNCFEPSDEYKGDFARAYFYISTVYNELAYLWQSPMMDNNTYPVWNDWALDLLLEWHRNDPVSDKEKKRQEAVYTIQYNRNPFIDYPTLAEHIWGDKKNAGFVLPVDERPFLLSPDKWTSINVSAALSGSTLIKTISVTGDNLIHPLIISLKHNSAGITLSYSEMTPEQVAAKTELKINITHNEIGTISDTIVFSSIGLTPVEIPVSANFTDQFMITEATPVSAVETSIIWMEKPDIQQYNLIIARGQQKKAPDLFFSGYVEGSSYNKAIAIFNGLDKPMDMSRYSIKKQSNGTGSFSCEYKLSGTLEPNETYVIANDKASEEIKAVADLITENSDHDPMNFNGNDALALYHNNIMIDIIGEAGNSEMWGENISMTRKTEIKAPNRVFNNDEWNIMPQDYTGHLKSHITDNFEDDKTPIKYEISETEYTVNNLLPGHTYTAWVETLPDKERTVNAIQFRTPDLNVPEAYEATDIHCDRFKANWETVPYADGYIIDLYTVDGTEEITVYEGFDAVGSTGKPLPENWSGTASGNYTTATSSGQTPPSVALKNTGEWLCSPMFDIPISSISFMYKFSGNGGKSYLSVYAIDKDGNETQIDSIYYNNSTSKTTVTYDKNILGSDKHSIKTVYRKDKGNMAIDDFCFTLGGKSYNKKDTKYTTDNYMLFCGLEPFKKYAYQVRAAVCYGQEDEAVSLPSNTVSVTTEKITDVHNGNTDMSHNIFARDKTIYITGIEKTSSVTIYDITGTVVVRKTAIGNATFIIPNSGIYIITIYDGTTAMKVYKTAIQ